MGLFGFGKKKKSAENIEDENKEENKIDSSAEDSEKSADSDAESQNDAERTVQRGPWDINDENVIEFEDTHLQLGSIYLPFMKDIKIFVKKEKDVEFLSGITISFRTSSLEIEPFAAPRSSGLWDKHRENLIASNPGAEETEGTFGKEVILPVSIEGGKTFKTRIVAVDGPRWMLRGIFTGPAASENGEEKEALEEQLREEKQKRTEERKNRSKSKFNWSTAPAEESTQDEDWLRQWRESPTCADLQNKDEC